MPTWRRVETGCGRVASDHHPTLVHLVGTWEYEDVAVLPHPPARYYVMQSGEVWRVVEVATGEVQYRGPGPVELIRSPAPF